MPSPPSRQARHDRRLLLAALVVLAAFTSAPAFAVSLGQERAVAARLTATGTVTALDPQARLLTLRSTRGDGTYRLDPKVRNLDQLKVGDRVRLDYVAAVVLRVKREGNGARDEVDKQVSALPGSPPAGHGRRVSFEADVVDVDKAAQSVRLKGPEGNVVEFQIRDEADLVGIKTGDRVVARVYEAVAVEVVPASR